MSIYSANNTDPRMALASATTKALVDLHAIEAHVLDLARRPAAADWADVGTANELTRRLAEIREDIGA